MFDPALVPRRALGTVQALLTQFPAVALVGPRQVGKTTLAWHFVENEDAVYLDLESPGDRARLTEPELYLTQHEDRLVILDEVHRTPEIFQVLRGLIDAGRRSGKGTGRFLILGSASIDLLRQSGESLAGRIAYVDLVPLDAMETATSTDHSTLWNRGGFPKSLLAPSDETSLEWRNQFIRTYLERDIPQFGPRIPTETIRRLWTMLAHMQGTMLNASALGRSLGIDSKTVGRYIDLLCDLLLVRRLPAWSRNSTKRLTRSPRIFVRDAGILHALLNIPTLDDLLSHPVVGASWEGFVIENLLSVAPSSARAYYYRASGGAELDLILELANSSLWAIEIKGSLSPKIGRGFHAACEDVQPDRTIIIYPGSESWPGPDNTTVMSLSACMSALS